MALELAWKLDHPVPCGNPQCDRKVLPHEPHVQFREVFVHEACVAQLEVKRRSRAEPCSSCPRGTDIFVMVRGGGRFALCQICLEEHGAKAPPEDVFEDRPEVREVHDFPDIIRICAALRMYLELSEESGFDPRTNLVHFGRPDAAAISRAHGDMLREAEDVLKKEVPMTLELIEDHDLHSDSYVLAKVAAAEIEGRNPTCSKKFKHVYWSHGDGIVHHAPPRPRRCHMPECFRCWRRDAADVLGRHARAIDELLERGTLFVLEVPWPASPIGRILKLRLEAWIRLLNRQLGRKPTYLVWAAPDRLAAVLEVTSDSGVHVGSERVRTWDELEQVWVPRLPFNLVLPDEDAGDAYKMSRKGCRLVRGRGAFARPAHPKTKTVVVDGKKRTLPVCGVCHEPAWTVTVVVLDEGQTCKYCPKKVAEDRTRIDFYAAGPPHR